MPGWKFDVAMEPVTLSDSSLRQSNPVLHGVPFRVIPDKQILLHTVRALDRAFVVRVDLAVVGQLLKRRGPDSPLQERKREGRIARFSGCPVRTRSEEIGTLSVKSTCRLSALNQARQRGVQLQRRVVIESAVRDIFAVWPAHATVTSLASPGFVSTSTSEPSEFFAAV